MCLPDRPYEKAGPHRRARPRGIQVRSNRARRQRAAGRCAAGSRGVRDGAGRPSGRCGGTRFALARTSPPPFRLGGPGVRPTSRSRPLDRAPPRRRRPQQYGCAFSSCQGEIFVGGLLITGLLITGLLITRCEPGPVVRRPDAQLLRRRLDGHAERINTDGDGHDCQRPSCGDSPFVRSSAPARWQATLPPRRGAPGDDRVPPERRGKRGLASREPRRQDRWELSRNGLTRRLHIDLSRVSSAY